jgi:hypothetical protein
VVIFVSAFTAEMGEEPRYAPSPGVTQDLDVTRANGAALLNDLVGDVFVRLHGD